MKERSSSWERCFYFWKQWVMRGWLCYSSRKTVWEKLSFLRHCSSQRSQCEARSAILHTTAHEDHLHRCRYAISISPSPRWSIIKAMTKNKNKSYGPREVWDFVVFCFFSSPARQAAVDKQEACLGEAHLLPLSPRHQHPLTSKCKQSGCCAPGCGCWEQRGGCGPQAGDGVLSQ